MIPEDEKLKGNIQIMNFMGAVPNMLFADMWDHLIPVLRKISKVKHHNPQLDALHAKIRYQLTHYWKEATWRAAVNWINAYLPIKQD